jgi:hypothetical protein
MKGYQLIELEKVGGLHQLFGGVFFEVILLEWVVSRLKRDSEIIESRVEIDLIAAEYTQKYPCVGVHYLDAATPNMEPLIISKVERLFTESSVEKLYSFVMENKQRIEKMNKLYRFDL